MKVLAGVSSGFLFLIITGCSSLFYYPDSYMYHDPLKLRIKPKQIEIIDRKQRKIVGWYFRNKMNVEPKAKILFFHGNAQNISSHFVSLYWILEEPYDFFIFDYPGYGGSDGEPDRDSVVEASRAAMKWLHENAPHVPMAIFGQSLGGNIALYTTARYQSEFPVCMIMVESTFLSYPKVAQTILASNYWSWGLQWLPYVLVSNYKSASQNLDYIPPTPLVIVHGDRDRTVPFKNGQQLFQEAHEPKEFWSVPKGGHIDGFTGSNKEFFRKKYLEVLGQHCS